MEELERAGADDDLISRAKSRRDDAKKMLRVAGGATESKLLFSARDAWTKMAKQDKAITMAEKDLDDAKRIAAEAEARVQRAASALDAARQRRRNTAEQYAYLTTNLAAEANTDRQHAVHSALQHLREAFGQHSPQVAHCLQALESFVASVAPAAAPPYSDDPVLQDLVFMPKGGDGAKSDCTSVVSGTDDVDVGDLILQPSIAAAERDLRDLISQRDHAVALAIRADGSQKEAALPFQKKIQAIQDRICRTKELLQAPARPPPQVAEPLTDVHGSSSHGASAAMATFSTVAASCVAPRDDDTAMDCEGPRRKRPLSVPRLRGGIAGAQSLGARATDDAGCAQSGCAPSVSALPAAFATAARAASVLPARPATTTTDDDVPAAFRPLAREGASIRAGLQDMVRSAQLPRPRGRSPRPVGTTAARDGLSAPRSRSERAGVP